MLPRKIFYVDEHRVLDHVQVSSFNQMFHQLTIQIWLKAPG